MKKILCLIMLLTVLFSASTFVSSSVASAEENSTTHQVTFKIDGETVDEVPVNHNCYLQMPETPSVENKIFLYWYKEGDVNTRFSFKTRITEDITLHAFFENTEKYYTVTFRVNGEDKSVQRVKEGESAIAPNNLEIPEGKTFSRWSENFLAVRSDLVVEAVLADVYYKVNVYAEDEHLNVFHVKYGEDLDLSEIVVPEKPNYVVDGFIGETQNITSNGNVYVNYLPKPINIIFNNADGSEYETLTTRYGETASMPVSLPVADEGYYFAGWAVGSVSGEFFDFSTIVYEDVVLYAVFKPTIKPKYEVKFYDHNGVQYGATQLVIEGSSAILPGDPTREGYKFDRWDVSVEKVTSNLDVYPIFKLDSYKVTFVDYLGEIAVEYVLHGQSVAIDQSLVRTREGYEFVRFDRSLKNITKETTINAVYRVKTYDVSFYSSNLTSLGGLQKIKHGQDAKAPNAEKEGYTFLGWKNLKTGEIEDTTSITKDCSFIATYTRNVYTVKFFEGETELHSVQIEYGRGFVSYTYEKQGYKFDGWYFDKELKNKYYATSIYKDTVLYAKWVEIVEEITYFTVNFVVDDVIYNQQLIKAGDKIVMPQAPNKEGYVFEYWNTGRGNYGPNTPMEFKVYEDYEIVAQFREATYTVKFYFGNYSSAGHTVYNVKHGEAVVFPEDENTEKTGYIFKGWDKKFDNVTSNLTINAIYEPLEYTITFTDDNNVVLFTQKVKHGEYIQWVENPVKEGYTFTGWWYNLDYTDPVEGDKTFKAQFNANSYKIYYYVDGVLWGNMTQTYSYGSYITPKGDPSINEETKKFLGWSEIPERVPAHDVEVYGTTYTYQYFNVYYLIDGEVWRTKTIREGKEIKTMNVYDVPDDEWKKAHENIVFKHWGDQPYYMPAEDVYVHAIIDKYEYYKVYFYIDGEIYTWVSCMEGKNFPSIGKTEIQAMFPETKVFDGWGEVPSKMPSHDVEVHAQFIYKNYYNLNYYIEDKIFASFTLLEGTIIEDTKYELTHADVPDDYLPEFKEFRGWKQLIPYSMPKTDLDIHASVHEYKLHKVTYKVDFDTVAELEVREGQPIPQIPAPESDGTRWFIGWNSSYETMPGYDIQVSAKWNYLNVIETKTVREDKDGVAMYKTTIRITDVVNFVAIKFKVTLSVPAEVILDETYASYNKDTGELIFASGGVITKDTDLITFYCGYDHPIKMYSFVDFEIYTINEQGEIVSTVCYMNNSKHEPRA